MGGESKMTRILAFLLVLGICQANSVPESINDKEVDLKYRLPTDIVEPISYKLHLTPDLDSEYTFEGEVDITLKALVTNNTLTLNSKGLKIHNVTFKDVNITTPLEIEYEPDEKHETLNIMTRTNFVKDYLYLLHIKFSGSLKDKTRGFYRSRVMNENQFHGYAATTHFEPTSAREAFPCWDEPNYKATFSIILTHNAKYNAISNTDVLTQEKKDNITTTIFKETPLMSTYLVAFVVSDYKSREDKVGNFTYRVWTKESTIGQTDYALKMGRKILKMLDTYTNIPFNNSLPDKMDQISQKDFPAGAMENWGLVIYREQDLLFDEELFTTQRKMRVLTVIAHEFAHQWFGDLVSPKWWKYVWLNEGFANYFQYFITHKIEPELRLNELFVVESLQQTAMVVDEVPDVRPMNKDVNTPQEISALFDSIAYSKAGSVIRMMSHALTEGVFRKGLQYYLTAHSYHNADSNDLFESLEKALKESDIKWPKSVNEVMQNWVEKSGYPVLTVKRVNESYQLTQDRFVFALMNIDKHPAKWWIPITYVEQSNPDFANTAPVDWFSPNDASKTVKAKQETGWYIFNTQQTGYYRVNYDEENWQLLTNELRTWNNTEIHVLNRAQMIDDSFNLARADTLNYTIPLNVSLYLTHESDYVPWQPAFRHLNFLRNLLRTSDKYYTFTRYVTYLMRALTKNVGYEPKANDSDLVKMLRVDTMKWACEAGVKNCTDYVENLYHNWLQDPRLKLDINLKKEILCAGVRKASPGGWTDTFNFINASATDADDKKDQLSVLACSNSSKILTNYLNSTLDPGYPIDFKTAASNIVSKYQAGPQLVFDFLLKEYERIQKIPNFKVVVGEIAVAIGRAVTNEQQYLDLNAFMVDRKLTESLQAVMEQATKNVKWIKRYKSIVDEWLDANSDLFESPEDDGTKAGSSASSMAIASFLVIFSLFITRFY